MKVYFDNSVLNRPFDDPNQGFNRLETDILFWILRLIEEGALILVNSSVVEYENSLNPSLERNLFVKSAL